MISQIIDFLDYKHTLGLSFDPMSNKLFQAIEDNLSNQQFDCWAYEEDVLSLKVALQASMHSVLGFWFAV